MPVCTFFGHRDCPESVKPKLREVLVDLVTNHDVDMFYVGILALVSSVHYAHRHQIAPGDQHRTYLPRGWLSDL